jgi:hypothetical protein
VYASPLRFTPISPGRFHKCIRGFQRMRMWLDAIQALDADLQILFFPRAGVRGGSCTSSSVARQLFELWGIRCNVVLCERKPQEQPGGRLSAYLRPALALSHHPDFHLYVGSRQSEAFARCLAQTPT